LATALRPRAWLTHHGLSVGGRFPFASHELGIEGVATVESIGHRPASAAAGSRPGARAVTGRIHRTAQRHVAVHVRGRARGG
jgi:hypothetical protein